jgi:hypothetical protein
MDHIEWFPSEQPVEPPKKVNPSACAPRPVKNDPKRFRLDVICTLFGLQQDDLMTNAREIASPEHVHQPGLDSAMT